MDKIKENCTDPEQKKQQFLLTKYYIHSIPQNTTCASVSATCCASVYNW